MCACCTRYPSTSSRLTTGALDMFLLHVNVCQCLQYIYVTIFVSNRKSILARSQSKQSQQPISNVMLWPKPIALLSNVRRKQVPGGLSGTSTVKYLVLAPHQRLIEIKSSTLIYLPSLFQANYCHPCPVQQKERMQRSRVNIGHILFLTTRLDHYISLRTTDPYPGSTPPACLATASYLNMRF